jgi:hypothetical protein
MRWFKRSLGSVVCSAMVPLLSSGESNRLEMTAEVSIIENTLKQLEQGLLRSRISHRPTPIYDI